MKREFLFQDYLLSVHDIHARGQPATCSVVELVSHAPTLQVIYRTVCDCRAICNAVDISGLVIEDDGELLGAAVVALDISAISGKHSLRVLCRYLVKLAVFLQDVSVGSSSRSVVHADDRAHEFVLASRRRQSGGIESFHLDVIAVELWRAVRRDQIRLVCFELILRIREMDCAVVTAREGVGFEALYRQLVGQAKGGFRCGVKVALVGNGGGGEVEPDGQWCAVGEAEVVARLALVRRVVVDIVRLALVGSIVEIEHVAQLLCPVALVGAVVLQLISHIAVLQLFLCYLHALLLATEVEVVSVVEGGVGSKGFCPSGGVVQRAFGLTFHNTYKCVQRFYFPVVRRDDLSLVDTVVNDKRGVSYSTNEARHDTVIREFGIRKGV